MLNDDYLMKLITCHGITCHVNISPSDYDEIKYQLSSFSNWNHVNSSVSYRVFQTKKIIICERGSTNRKTIRRVSGDIGGRSCELWFHDTHSVSPPEILKTEKAFSIKTIIYQLPSWSFSLETWYQFPDNSPIPNHYVLSIHCDDEDYIKNNNRRYIIDSLKMKIDQCFPDSSITWNTLLSNKLLLIT